MSNKPKKAKLTKADEEWWLRKREQETGVHCRWSPEYNVTDVLFIRDPDNLTKRQRYHIQMMLNMIIASGGDLARARQIIFAHPQLRAEYEPKINKRANELYGHRFVHIG